MVFMLLFFPLFRNRNELAETLALLKAQIDPVLLKNSSQQDTSSRESPSLEDEETKKEEETPKQGFFVCFILLCFVFSALLPSSTQLYNSIFLSHLKY